MRLIRAWLAMSEQSSPTPRIETRRRTVIDALDSLFGEFDHRLSPTIRNQGQIWVGVDKRQDHIVIKRPIEMAIIAPFIDRVDKNIVGQPSSMRIDIHTAH